MANRAHALLAVVEDDMADVAAADLAVEDLEALLLKLSRRPVATLDDVDRMSDGLRTIRSGLVAVRKHLIDKRQS